MLFSNVKALIEHTRRAHEGNKICEDCGQSFSNKYYHMLKYHKNIATNRIKKRLNLKAKMMKNFQEVCRCNLDLTYKSEVYILKHYKTIHLGYVKCPKCRKWIRDHKIKHVCREGTKSHTKHGLKLFACDECDFGRNCFSYFPCTQQTNGGQVTTVA